ncbi:hypothetical protein ANCCAN_07791 [Ancylostoma caninum]|uniref:Uncharacterized protein n=1 Tax=Ancylostoma caninum TaxID=29170 RepID=A0A368GP38_ANCCA|nr:hypothetical protein ANCCAN_07791 [Ancylostoma caninum]
MIPDDVLPDLTDDKNAIPVAKNSSNLTAMKFLLGAGVSAVVTYIFINISLFTQEWVTASITQYGLTIKQSSGIFPWVCVSENSCNLFWEYADGWAIVLFLGILFAWILQFFAVVAVISSLTTNSSCRIVPNVLEFQIGSLLLEEIFRLAPPTGSAWLPRYSLSLQWDSAEQRSKRPENANVDIESLQTCYALTSIVHFQFIPFRLQK